MSMLTTFIWDPAVAWPPPAHIMLNYDVVAPGYVAVAKASESLEARQAEVSANTDAIVDLDAHVGTSQK